MINYKFILGLLSLVLLSSCHSLKKSVEEQFYASPNIVDAILVSNSKFSLGIYDQSYIDDTFHKTQLLIDQARYTDALSYLIQHFSINTSLFRKIVIVPEHVDSSDIAVTDLSLKISISYAAFRSADYLWGTLVHELGHILQRHRLYDIFKKSSKIEAQVNNISLAEVINASYQRSLHSIENYIEKTKIIGITVQEYLFLDGYRVSASKIDSFFHLIRLFSQDIHEYFIGLFEMDACMFALKHAHSWSISLSSTIYQRQLQYFVEQANILESDSLRLDIEIGFEKALKHVESKYWFINFSTAEREYFLSSLDASLENIFEKWIDSLKSFRP